MFDILEYIEQQMKNLGISKYALRPVVFKNAIAQVQEIQSFNQYYLLVSNHPFNSMEIVAGNTTKVFPAFAEYQTHVAERYVLLTGSIRITQTPFVNVELIQIIPERDDS